MKEKKKVFLEVDQIEPVYDGVSSRLTYIDGIKVWIGGEGHLFQCDRFTVCYPDDVREDGRRQVVALMNELGDMVIADREKLFDYGLSRDILNNFSYEEIVEKLDAWKKEKKAIRVRDEVVNAVGKRFVVTVPPYMGSNSVLYFSGIAEDGTVYKDQPVATYKKTGLHVDDLDAYLGV